jgi:mRNA interferase MazF
MVARKAYVPDRGDLIWLSFDPQAGREQAGHRPALVMSPRNYNDKAGLALCCPITSQVKGYPFEVTVSLEGKNNSVILSDQLRSLDWRVRKAKFIKKCDTTVFARVVELVGLLVEG